MTSDTTGADERPIEERLRVVEQIVTLITKRNADIDGLADATERLTISTAGVENVLRDVGTAMSASTEAKATAQTAMNRAEDNAVALVASEKRYRRHTRVMATVALATSLVATGGVLYLQQHAARQFSAFLDNAQRRCEARRAYDQANHLSVGADVDYYRSQLKQARDNKASTDALIASFPKAQRATLRAEVRAAHQALHTALAVKEQAFQAGVIGSCGSLH